MMDESLESTHQFVDRYIAAAEEAEASYDSGTGDVHLRLRLDWDVDEALSSEFHAELARIRRAGRRRRWFDR